MQPSFCNFPPKDEIMNWGCKVPKKSEHFFRISTVANINEKKSHSQKKSHSTFIFIFWIDKYWLKMPKNLNIAVKQCYQTGQFERTKIGGKCQNATFWIIFMHCEIVVQSGTDNIDFLRPWACLSNDAEHIVWKSPKNVTFEFFNFGIFHKFLSNQK